MGFGCGFDKFKCGFSSFCGGFSNFGGCGCGCGSWGGHDDCGCGGRRRFAWKGRFARRGCGGDWGDC